VVECVECIAVCGGMCRCNVWKVQCVGGMCVVECVECEVVDWVECVAF